MTRSAPGHRHCRRANGTAGCRDQLGALRRHAFVRRADDPSARRPASVHLPDNARAHFRNFAAIEQHYRPIGD
jgi:hypothetical protein